MTTDFVAIDELLVAARVVAACLKELHPGDPLCTYDDWHEHDGYVTTPKPATWGDVEAALADAESLARWTSDDEYVRRAWRDVKGSFLLRWFRYDESGGPPPDYPPVGGELDLTAEPALIKNARERLAAKGIGVVVADPVAFFTQSWGG